MSKLNIKVKMTMWYCLLSAILLIVFLPLLYTTIESSMKTNLENELRGSANKIISSIHFEKSNFDLDLGKVYEQDTMIAVFGENGELFDANSKYQWMNDSEIHKDTIYQKNDEGKNWLVYDASVQNNHGDTIIIRVAKTTGAMDASLSNIRMLMLVGSPLFLIFSLLSGMFIARRTLKPVVKISQVAKEIEEGDLTKRIVGITSKDEVGYLAESFNSMVEHLEVAFKREQQFASDASHELRTPVAIIMNYSEQLLNDDNKEEYQIIHNESKRMNRIIAQLLSLTRGYEGKYQLDIEKMDVYTIVTNVMDQLQDYANSAGIELIYPKQKDVFISVDQSLWTQLYLNLIENAIKYGQPNGYVEVSIYSEKNKVITVVRDNGIGISSTDIPFVFERFYREDASRDRTGTGLGLSIAKWIIEIHHANIEVESVVKEGTTFTVIIDAD